MEIRMLGTEYLKIEPIIEINKTESFKNSQSAFTYLNNNIYIKRNSNNNILIR
jgi:hypothetical protein